MNKPQIITFNFNVIYARNAVRHAEVDKNCLFDIIYSKNSCPSWMLAVLGSLENKEFLYE
ncbi:MAG: hypothetical protein A2096_16930 [Spirochaetes bacterium GWF1_41_5]|nr:MAG: hypothetical protein A2096_16930 [Spirochaetes bacterium GWF1_41_5]